MRNSKPIHPFLCIIQMLDIKIAYFVPFANCIVLMDLVALFVLLGAVQENFLL